jgi:hypothetical protein
LIMKAKSISKELVEEAKKLYEIDGYSFGKLAARYGVTRGSVQGWVRRGGWVRLSDIVRDAAKSASDAVMGEGEASGEDNLQNSPVRGSSEARAKKVDDVRPSIPTTPIHLVARENVPPGAGAGVDAPGVQSTPRAPPESEQSRRGNPMGRPLPVIRTIGQTAAQQKIAIDLHYETIFRDLLEHYGKRRAALNVSVSLALNAAGRGSSGAIVLMKTAELATKMLPLQYEGDRAQLEAQREQLYTMIAVDPAVESAAAHERRALELSMRGESHLHDLPPGWR